MLNNQVDLLKPLRFVRYGRMSTDQQNPRSPDQQFDTINDLIRRRNLPWTEVGSYRDDGVSGRLIRRRPGFQKMREDIRLGRIETDLILVDTIERFGRSDDIREIRRKLQERYGVLVLTADSNFEDPTSVAGNVLSVIESLRATEDNRVKAHTVLRGKRDAVRRKRWPGGTPPFGYRLDSIFKDTNGRREVDYSILVRDPSTAWIIEALFLKARETGWGTPRLAKFLNSLPNVPTDLKPFDAANVGYWLRCSTYIGTYVWEKVNTGVHADRRVSRKTSDAKRIIVEGFCEPIVSREVWDEVQELRRVRAAARPSPRRTNSREERALAPVSHGLVMTYPLTGLVRCGSCGRSMIPASSSPYTSVSGDIRRYVNYRCPALASGACDNRIGVPEDWLRRTVMQSLSTHLGLTAPIDGDPADSETVMVELIELVNQALKRHVSEQPSAAAAIEAEIAAIDQNVSGWRQSLGRPDLMQAIRCDLEQQWEKAADRKQILERQLRDEVRQRQRQELVVDREEIQHRVQSLHEAIVGENATLANLQLSLHIDRIVCFPDRRVVLRTCKLSMFPDVASLIDQFAEANPQNAADPIRQRRRGRLAIDDNSDEGLEDAMHFGMDPERFADLPAEWFWTDEFEIPRRLSWAKSHAQAVADFRTTTHLSMVKTAKHFGVSIPTIKAALQIAKTKLGINALGKELSLPTRPNWPRDNAQRVAEFLSQPGVTRKAAAAHFGKCETWIKKAFDIARSQGLPNDAADTERAPDDDGAGPHSKAA